MARVLVSPLSWGLGHATRDIPVIRELVARKHSVTVASSGSALLLLQKEFPGCHFRTLPDYPKPYAANRFFRLKFAAYIPRMLKAIAREKENLDRLLADAEPYDLIISDNRFGVYAENIPSFFISHQLRFSAPAYLFPIECYSQYFNSRHHRHFNRVIVPDNPPDQGSLSGKLCRSNQPATNQRIYFAGILCSVERQTVKEDIDFLVSISGPEPQRSRLEEILLPQIPCLPGEKMVLLGKPEEDTVRRPDSRTTIKSHASRAEMSDLMNRARFIITRSGYTTMMEMAELGKTKALLIPTAGQTEQEYLSRYYEKKGWFYSQDQDRVDLPAAVRKAEEFRGFPSAGSSAANARRLYEELLGPFLEK